MALDFSYFKQSNNAGIDAFTLILLVLVLLVICAASVIVFVVGLLFIMGSKWLASRYENLTSYRKSFTWLSILAILFQLFSVMLFIYSHLEIWIYNLTCLLGSLLGGIVIASVNKINRNNEDGEKKRLYLYSYVVNMILLIFNILPLFLTVRISFWEYVMTAILTILHLLMVVLGRFFDKALYQFE